jgi:hypothetical protein
MGGCSFGLTDACLKLVFTETRIFTPLESVGRATREFNQQHDFSLPDVRQGDNLVQSYHSIGSIRCQSDTQKTAYHHDPRDNTLENRWRPPVNCEIWP